MSDMHMTGGEEAMAGLYAQCASSVVGGSTLQNPRVIGGLDDIKDYANTVMSKAKEKLIRDIARDMKTKFKVEGKGATKIDINPDTDLKTLIAQLKKAIPDPNTNGRVWSSKLGTQKSACKQMAKIINDRYGFAHGSGMINENGDPEEICEQVSEVMYTLFVGMHGEFLNVREDALRMAKNLHLLQDILERNFRHLETKMKNSDDSENVMAETKLAREGHQMVMDEVKRQQAMLNNTLNVVITPEDKDIAKLLKQSKDFKHLVKKIKAMPGTGKFGEKVAFVLSGVGTTAQMAQVVDAALKKVSMSLSEYGRPKDIKGLESAIFEKLQSKLSGSSAKELEEYVKAAKSLFRYDYRRPEIVAKLSKHDNEDSESHGSAEEVIGGLKLDKRVKDRDDLKKALVGAFNRQLGTHLERINASTESIARATGRGVPVTDALRQFTKRLELIPDIEKRHIFFALTGYYNDAASKEARGYFLDNVQALVESLEKMSKMSEYSSNEHVRDLLRSWNSVISLIKDYASRFDKGFGAIQPKVSPSKYGQSEEVIGGGPWWTAVKTGLEAAGVTDPSEQSKLYSGEDGESGIKKQLKDLLDAGNLPWEKFTETVEELVMKATGKKVTIKDKALEQEIQETQERLAAREHPDTSEESSDEGEAVQPGQKKPSAKKAPKKAPKKKSHRKKGRGEDDEEDDEEDSHSHDAYYGGSVTGGADAVAGAVEDELIMGGALTVNEISRLADNLNRSKDVMRYFFRAADIRRNMAYVAPELKEFGKDYEKVLGDAIAKARDDIIDQMNAELVPLRAGKKANMNTDSDLKNRLVALYALETNARPGTDAEKLYVDDRLKEISAFKEKFYTCKINMLKCTEAMDLYMKHFTDGIVTNIDDVQKIEVMLRGTEIISKWFSSRSGNLICSVFDTFPGVIENAGAAPGDWKYSNLPRVWHDKTNLRDLHYYWRVQSQCRLVGVPAAIVNAQGALTALSANNLSSKDESVKNYEKALNAAAGAWVTFEDSTQPGGSAVRADLVGAGNIGIPGIPYLGIVPNKEGSGVAKSAANNAWDNVKHRDAAKAMDFVTKAFENVSVLKNIIAAFVAIGDKFGGQDIRKKTHMSPVQIYNSLVEYMTVGSFTMGLNRNTRKNMDPGYNVAGSTMQTGATQGFHFGTGPEGSPIPDPLNKLTVAMRQADRNAAHVDLFKGGLNTDQMFVFVVKAMVAKILTVIGVYNMLNRPIDRHALGYASATRWTLGGSDSLPKIIPEVFELYVRLPLLAEFYRETFKFDKDTPVLSMVPHMDGTYQGLVELIFDRAKHIKYGTYSETDIKTMIEEINKIYMTYKGSKTMVQDVMHEFVAEVNRRYGILLNEERSRYQKMDSDRYTERYDSNIVGDDRVDYDILPEEMGSMVGPSDSYVTKGSKISGDLKDHKWNLRIPDHQRFIRQLRMKLDQNLTDVWPTTAPGADDSALGGLEKLKTLSFENLVKSRTEEMKYARSAKEQFRIVQQAINGLGEFSMNAQERSLILFHETVIAGLNTMTALYSMVAHFHGGLWGMANTVHLTEKFYKEKAAGAGNHGAANPAIAAGNLLYALDAPSGNKKGQPAYVIATVANDTVATANGSKLNGQYGLRTTLDQSTMAHNFIELLYGHCSSLDGLVELQMEVIDHPDCATDADLRDTQKVSAANRPKSLAISVDHSKLYELVERELSCLKSILDKFRGLVPKEIISRYELGMDTSGAPNVGSIYWLEKHFVIELLAGKSTDWRDENLSNVNGKVRTVMNYLTKPWRFDAAVATTAGAAPVAQYAAGPWFEQENFGHLMDNLISFSKATNINAVALPAARDIGLEPTLLQLGSNPIAYIPNTANRLPLYDAANLHGVPDQKGVVALFNQLVASYLYSCYDQQSEKIYVNTIEGFANGAFSDAVMKPNQTFDDNAAYGGGVVDHVLTKSLAFMMRNLLVAKFPQKTFKHFIETDMAEIPLFMKEGFKANMPVYTKLFTLLIKRCEHLKAFSQAFEVSTPAVGANGLVSNDAAKRNHINQLNQVISGSQALLGCMRDVLEELADAPVYLETHKDSIKEYESMNGYKPLAPMSSMLYYLQDNAQSGPETRPGGAASDQGRKLLYGTRGVLSLNGEYGLSKMPSMREILQKHNETTDSGYHIDEKTLSSHVSDTMLSLRYVATGKHYTSFLTSFVDANINAAAALTGGGACRSHLKVSLVSPVAAPRTVGIQLDSAVYALGDDSTLNRSLTNVLQITENSKQRDSRQRLVKIVEQSDKTIVRGSREQIRMMNIIDMNIVPINVHALMREMPLVNLFNYSYTFDSMVCNMMGLEYQHMVPDYTSTNDETDRSEIPNSLTFAKTMRSTPIRERARKFMGYMLLHPYVEISDNDYHDYFGRIVRGATGIAGLGRPKFLGDELYNKALFGEVYTNEKYWDEAGPAVGEAAGPGRSRDNRAQVAEQVMIDAFAGNLAGNPTNPVPVPAQGAIDISDAGLAGLPNLRVAQRQRRRFAERVATHENRPALVADSQAALPAGLGFNAAAVPPVFGDNTSDWWNALIAAVDAAVLHRFGENTTNTPPNNRGSNYLHYLHPTKDGRGEIIAVDVGEHKQLLQNIGKLRFDTFYCRSLVWLTQIQRVLRLKLRQDLEWYDSRIVKDNAVTSPDITELYGNDAHSFQPRHYSN